MNACYTCELREASLLGNRIRKTPAEDLSPEKGRSSAGASHAVLVDSKIRLICMLLDGRRNKIGFRFYRKTSVTFFRFSHRIATSPLQELGRPKEISSLKTREDIPREYNKQIDEFSRSTHALLQSMSNLEARLQRKDSQMRNLSTTLINGSS